MKEKKKKKGLARLMEIAGQRKGLLIVAGTLSALSSACMLVPYWAVYEVLRLLLTGNAASGEMVHWGWVAFGGLVVIAHTIPDLVGIVARRITGSVLQIIFRSLISLCFITCLIRISFNLKKDQNRPHDPRDPGRTDPMIPGIKRSWG